MLGGGGINNDANESSVASSSASVTPSTNGAASGSIGEPSPPPSFAIPDAPPPVEAPAEPPPPEPPPEPPAAPPPVAAPEPPPPAEEEPEPPPPAVPSASEPLSADEGPADDPARIAATPVQTGRTEMASPEMVAQLKAELAAASSGSGAHPPPIVAEPVVAEPDPADSSGVREAAPTIAPREKPASPDSNSLGRLPDPAPASGHDLSDLEGPGALAEAKARVFARVAETLAPAGELPPRDANARARARTEAQRLLSELASRVPGLEPRPSANRIAGELCGLGALSAPLAEPDVTEVFVHGPGRVFVRRVGQAPERTDARFSCPQAIATVIHRLTGVALSSENPIVDARTFDGADVHAVHGSIASGGPVVSITLPGPEAPPATLEALTEEGMLDATLGSLLSAAVAANLNILVCSGPGTQTFPLLTALASEAAGLDGATRQVVVRPGHEPGTLPDGAILLQGDGVDGGDDVPAMQSLVRAAVGLSPDRLVVHEVSGPEAAAALAALGRGFRGCTISTRAATARDAIARLAALVGLGDGTEAGLSPSHAARSRAVARSFDLAIAVARFTDGVSRIVAVSEPTVDDEGAVGAHDLARWDTEANACGPTGDSARPSGSFAAALQHRGINLDPPWSG